MDFSNLKEEFISFCKNVSAAFFNSSAFYFMKEKYDHLSPLYRKILHGIVWVFLSGGLLYYPVYFLYSSWKNTHKFKTEKRLTQDLISVSLNKEMGAGLFYSSKRNPVPLMRQSLRALRIPQKQVSFVKKAKSKGRQVHLPQNLLDKTDVVSLEVAMENLNLKEVVQYGYRLESFSDNIKMGGIRIKETPAGNNYFNVSYILNIFRLKEQGTPTTTSLNKRALPKGGVLSPKGSLPKRGVLSPKGSLPKGGVLSPKGSLPANNVIPKNDVTPKNDVIPSITETPKLGPKGPKGPKGPPTPLPPSLNFLPTPKKEGVKPTKNLLKNGETESSPNGQTKPLPIKPIPEEDLKR